MTPYERGYAAALKAAAEKLEESGFFKDHRMANEILSLPIVGEATNPGEQECVMVPVEPSPYVLIEMSKWFQGDTGAQKRRECYAAMLVAVNEEHDAHR